MCGIAFLSEMALNIDYPKHEYSEADFLKDTNPKLE